MDLIEPNLRYLFEREPDLGLASIAEDDNEDLKTDRFMGNKKQILLLNFLCSLGLEVHFDTLVAAGFDNLDSMVE